MVGAKGIKRGILNMDRQSVGRLERIEIVKGASSAVYGSDAIGGVINMITREPRYPLEASVTTSGGSLNRFDMRADVGFVKDKWSGFFEAERHKQNPFSLVPSQFGTTAPGFHRYDYLGKLGYDISDRLKLRATAHAFVNQDKGAYFSEFGPTDSTTDDTAQHYSLSADIGVTPLTQLECPGFLRKIRRKLGVGRSAPTGTRQFGGQPQSTPLSSGQLHLPRPRSATTAAGRSGVDPG